MTDSLAPGIWACIFVTFVLATTALVLRFYARWITRVSLGYDDYLAIASYIAALSYDISCIFFLNHGLGKHLSDIHMGLDDLRYHEAMLQEIEEHTYTLSIGWAQLSLLALYWRLFSANRAARISIISLACISLGWIVARLFVGVFQCYPPRFFWDKNVEGGICTVDPSKFFLGSVSTHLAMDIALIVMPATQINRLMLPLSQKIGIGMMFMFGVVVCAASVMMLVTSSTYNSDADDIMYNTAGPLEWSAAEIHLSIITCCLPTLRPVMQVASRCLGVKTPSRSSESFQFSTSSQKSRRGYNLGSHNHSSLLTSGDADGKDSTHQLSNVKADQSFGQPPGHEPVIGSAARGDLEEVELGQTADRVIKVKYEVNMTFSERDP